MKQQSGQLRQYYRRKAYGIELLGGKCVWCGSQENLEFDHIVKVDKSFSIGKCYSKRFEDFDAELRKCQLLCHSCHKKKNETDNGKAEHGKLSMYRHHGCRCEFCSSANRSYMKAYFQRKPRDRKKKRNTN